MAFHFSMQSFNTLKLQHVSTQFHRYDPVKQDQNRTCANLLFTLNPNQSAYFLKEIPLNGITLAVFRRKIVKSKSKKN